MPGTLLVQERASSVTTFIPLLSSFTPSRSRSPRALNSRTTEGPDRVRHRLAPRPRQGRFAQEIWFEKIICIPFNNKYTITVLKKCTK